MENQQLLTDRTKCRLEKDRFRYLIFLLSFFLFPFVQCMYDE